MIKSLIKLLHKSIFSIIVILIKKHDIQCAIANEKPLTNSTNK